MAGLLRADLTHARGGRFFLDVLNMPDEHECGPNPACANQEQLLKELG
jgi:hypothetical protein